MWSSLFWSIYPAECNQRFHLGAQHSYVETEMERMYNMTALVAWLQGKETRWLLKKKGLIRYITRQTEGSPSGTKAKEDEVMGQQPQQFHSYLAGSNSTPCCSDASLARFALQDPATCSQWTLCSAGIAESTILSLNSPPKAHGQPHSPLPFLSSPTRLAVPLLAH